MTTLQGKHLHFDCQASGIAGDMTLGAMIDLGVPLELFHAAFEQIGLGADRLRVAKVTKGGIAATDVKINVEPRESAHTPDHEHAHGRDANRDVHSHAHDELHQSHGHSHGAHHSHGDHHSRTHDDSHESHGHSHGDHYHYRDLVSRITNARLREDVKARSLAMLQKVAHAEAKLHGVTVEQVAFHEVGAIDSLADIVGTAVAMSWLSPKSVSSSPVAVGLGTVGSSHGVLPVPSPAALEILREVGAPLVGGNCKKELCTPTGAAILAANVTRWNELAMVPIAVGYGAGDLELPDRPNVLRIIVGSEVAPSSDEWMYRVECNIDDMSPEVCSYAAEKLRALGASEVWWTAVTGKKGRPGWLFSTLLEPKLLDDAVAMILAETSSIGVRFERVQRRIGSRTIENVVTRYGHVALKVASYQNKIVNVAPEFEICREAAERHNVAVKEVMAEAMTVWRSKKLQ